MIQRRTVRDALKNLIKDVTAGRADFDVVLVFDLSRWGRFQDIDESAHYEYLCRSAGVDVIYCAEPFVNDRSISSAIIKNLKRVMASEYSRDLSDKTFFGHCRVARLGFHTTAPAGYGLRRVPVDSNGNRKQELCTGEWKNIRTDRIVLAPGPAAEVETVKNIYRLFVRQKLSLADISRRLNVAGIANGIGRPWRPGGVRHVLSSERYIGNYVYNRMSYKLKGKLSRNPSSEWIRTEGAFEPIVSKAMFQRAQQQLIDNDRAYTRQELLDALTAIWRSKGALSSAILAATKGAPSEGAYQRCFGGLIKAYRQIGYDDRRWHGRAANHDLARSIYSDLAATADASGNGARFIQSYRAIELNGEFSISVRIARMSRHRSGAIQWRFSYQSKDKADITVVARLDAANDAAADYFVLPFPTKGSVDLTEDTRAQLSSFRMRSIQPLLKWCSRVAVTRATKVGPGPRLKLERVGARPQSAAETMNVLRNVFANDKFVKVLEAEGVQTIPFGLKAASAGTSNLDGSYAAEAINVVIATAFLRRLVVNPKIAEPLNRCWPCLSLDLTNIQKMLGNAYPNAADHRKLLFQH